MARWFASIGAQPFCLYPGASNECVSGLIYLINGAAAKHVIEQPTGTGATKERASALPLSALGILSRRVLARGGVTKTVVARALEVSESRVGEWVAAKRGVTTVTAMEIW